MDNLPQLLYRACLQLVERECRNDFLELVSLSAEAHCSGSPWCFRFEASTADKPKMATPAPFAWLLVCSTNGVPILSFRHNVPRDSPAVSLSTQGLVTSLYSAASEAGMVLRGMTTMPLDKVEPTADEHSACINPRDATSNDVEAPNVTFRHALAWKRFDSATSADGATGCTSSNEPTRTGAAAQKDGCIMAFLTDGMQRTRASGDAAQSVSSNVGELERCLSFLHSLFVSWLGPAAWSSLCRNPNQRQLRLSLAPLAPVIDTLLSLRPMLTCGGWNQPYSLVFSEHKRKLLCSLVRAFCITAQATHAFLLCGAVCTIASTENGLGAIDESALNVLYHTSCLLESAKPGSEDETPTAVKLAVLHLPMQRTVVPFHVATVPLGLSLESGVQGSADGSPVAMNIAVGVVDSPWRLLLLRPCQLQPVPNKEGEGTAGGATEETKPLLDERGRLPVVYGNQWHVPQLLESLAQGLHSFACRCGKEHAAGQDNHGEGATDSSGAPIAAPSSPQEPQKGQDVESIGEKALKGTAQRSRHSLLPTLLACMAQAENRAKAVHKAKDLNAYWPAVGQQGPSTGGVSRPEATLTTFAAAYTGGFSQAMDKLEQAASSVVQAAHMKKSIDMRARRVRTVDTVLDASEVIQWAQAIAGTAGRGGAGRKQEAKEAQDGQGAQAHLLYDSSQALPKPAKAAATIPASVDGHGQQVQGVTLTSPPAATPRQRLVLCKVTVTGTLLDQAQPHTASFKAQVYVLGRGELPCLRVTFGCHGRSAGCAALGHGPLYSGSPARPSATQKGEDKAGPMLCSGIVGSTVLPYLGLDTGCVRALVCTVLANAQEAARGALAGKGRSMDTPVCVQGPHVDLPADTGPDFFAASSSPLAASSSPLPVPGPDPPHSGRVAAQAGAGEGQGHKVDTAQWSVDTQDYINGLRVFNVATRVSDLQPSGIPASGVSVTVDVTASIDLHSLRSVLDEIAGLARRIPQPVHTSAEEIQEAIGATLEWKTLEAESVAVVEKSAPSHSPSKATPRSPPASMVKGKGQATPRKKTDELSAGAVAATRLRQTALKSPDGKSKVPLTPQQASALERIRVQQAALAEMAAGGRTGAADATVPAPSAAAPVDVLKVTVPFSSPSAVEKLQGVASVASMGGSPGTQRALLSAFKKERVAKAEVKTEIEQVRARLRAQKAALQLEIEKAKLAQAQKVLQSSRNGTVQKVAQPPALPSPPISARQHPSRGTNPRPDPFSAKDGPAGGGAEPVLVIRREPSLYTMPHKHMDMMDQDATVLLTSPTQAPRTVSADRGRAGTGGVEMGKGVGGGREAAVYGTPSPQRKNHVLDVDTPTKAV